MPKTSNNARKLMDRLGPSPEYGAILGLLATTYELDPEFFETDHLPNILGLGAWDDRRWTSRVAMEKQLAEMEAASILLDARRYPGRPRSLRVEVVPVALAPGRKLHAKILLILHERAVRLLVGSANLTTSGYRRNREVAASLAATAQRNAHGPIIRTALADLRALLAGSLTEAACRLIQLADERLAGWGGKAAADTWFAFSGGTEPLWQRFLSRWPQDEPIERITIVSPFWSEEEREGPVSRFVSILRDRGLLASGAALRLLAEAVPETQTTYKPSLPESFKAFDSRPLGVAGEAWAVDPSVPTEELGLDEQFTATRPLHAKIVLLEGRSTALGYLGSANFSRRGWGFLAVANLEAGLVVRRRGNDRHALSSIVPPTIGRPVALCGDAGDRIAQPPPDPAERLWPAFLREVVLSPSPADVEKLDLLVLVAPEQVRGAWSIGPVAGDAGTAAEPFLVHEVPAALQPQYRVALAPEQLNRLLVGQQVLVKWWDWDEGREVPINVDLAARENLPIAPGSDRLDERSLIAYYQGRVRWEDLFPDPDGPPSSEPGDNEPREPSGVDTSRIQSYQIREFVEALSGIRADLNAAAGASRPCMRLALLGSVSPVALAARVAEAVCVGDRSPVAGAFQLMEILACLQWARGLAEDERARRDWNEQVDTAVGRVEAFLGELRAGHRKYLGHGFRKYENAVRRHTARRTLS